MSHTDPSGQIVGPDPSVGGDTWERIACQARGGNWDTQRHICRERVVAPPPNNSMPNPLLQLKPSTADANYFLGQANQTAGALPRQRTGRDVDLELLGNTIGGLLLTCSSLLDSTIPRTQERDRDNSTIDVLTVGDGGFAYTLSLSSLHSNWRILGTTGPGDGTQTIVPSVGNLMLLDNVDARNLNVGITGTRRYDAIIFNNPHAGSNNTGPATAELITRFIQSARGLLKPNGEIHINATKAVLNEYSEVKAVLGLPTGTFGQSRYYAPYIPRYTTGGPFPSYAGDTLKSAKLLNFVFR